MLVTLSPSPSQRHPNANTYVCMGSGKILAYGAGWVRVRSKVRLMFCDRVRLSEVSLARLARRWEGIMVCLVSKLFLDRISVFVFSQCRPFLTVSAPWRWRVHSIVGAGQGEFHWEEVRFEGFELCCTSRFVTILAQCSG